MIFRKNGIEFELSPLFFIITSLLLLFDKSGYMSFSMLFSLCHEFGHIIAMFIIHKPPRAIKIKIYGFEINTVSFSIAETIFISAAGPLINLLSVLFCLILSSNINYKLLDLIYINIVIAAFNLLPVKNLDGGDILFSILTLKFSRNKADKLFRLISLSFSIIIMIFGIFLFFYGNMGVLLIGIYLFGCNFIKSD